MLLHFLVASVQAGPRSKTIELGLRFCSKFDQDLAASDQALAAFCFPLGAEAQAPKEYMASEEYTFTLTKADGSRFSGFCRRFLPPMPKQGPKLRYARVICLIAEAPWFAFFSKVLQTLEHLIKQSDLLDAGNVMELPQNSAAGQFLRELSQRLEAAPQLGSIVRVPVPPDANLSSFSPPKKPGNSHFSSSNDTELELHVPQDCGNGSWNAGISMARLLYHVPVPAMMTLIASMLLERRIILVGQSRDMVSAAIHAANAFLYPFRWHHIFLPLLPKHFKDYLTAPMPFLVGMPAQLLPMLKGIPMNEFTMIDLDLAKCEPAPGSRNDDALQLPWRDRLELALHTAYSQLRSPTEYESNPLITGIMQEYFLKLVGGYRKFITEIEPSERTKGGRRKDDGILYGDTLKFDHGAFVASFRGLERARNFLQQFRHSQMYEVFIQERLQLAEKNFVTDDIFECKVLLTMERRSKVQEMSSKVQARYNKTVSKLGAILRKHGRNASMDSSSGDLVATGQRNLRVQTEGFSAAADRNLNSGASTPASASSHHLPALVDLHQLFESESDAESDLSAFSIPIRHSESSSELDRMSTGPPQAESSASVDADNTWRAINGASSVASTPKPVMASNLISLDEEHPPGSRPPDAFPQPLASTSVPNLAPPPRANPFSSTQRTPPPPASYNANTSQPKQPTATARFMSILDAALSTASDAKPTTATPRPPFATQATQANPPGGPASSAPRAPRVSKEHTFGSLFASYGKDAWSELSSVARDVRESVREVRQTLGRNSNLPSPAVSAAPSRLMSFNNNPGGASTAGLKPDFTQGQVQAPNGSPSHKMVDDFLSSSMVTMGLSPALKPANAQPGPSMQQLRSQSSLDAGAAHRAVAASEQGAVRTVSNTYTEFASSSSSGVTPAPPSTQSCSTSAPTWDPFDVLASSTAAAAPAVAGRSSLSATTSLPAAGTATPSTSTTWDPFSETANQPHPPAPRAHAFTPSITSPPGPLTANNPAPHLGISFSALAAAPVTQPAPSLPLASTTSSVPDATLLNDPFAALAASTRSVAPLRSAPAKTTSGSSLSIPGAASMAQRTVSVEIPQLL